MSTWCTRNSDEIVTETVTIDPTGRYHSDMVWYSCPDGTQQGDYYDGSIYVSPEDIPEPENKIFQTNQLAADAAVRWYQENTERIRVGSAPVIDPADQSTWDTWMKAQYDAIDIDDPIPDPPAKFRQAVDLPNQQIGTLYIKWYALGDWGVRAVIRLYLGNTATFILKVYDEAKVYNHDINLQASFRPDEYTGDTPGGFTTPTKINRYFVLNIDGVDSSDLILLDATKTYFSFAVKI